MRAITRTLAFWLTLAVLTIVLGASPSCGRGQPQQQPASMQTPEPKVPTGAERAAWYQECWAHFNNRHWDGFRACYADAVESERVGSGQPLVKGAEAAIASVQSFAAAFPDAKGTGELILVNGNSLASIYTVTGTHTGPLVDPVGKSIPPTNRRIGFLQAHLIQMEPSTGKVVKEEFYADSGTMMAQIGVNAGPARPAVSSATPAPKVAVAAGSPIEGANVQAALAQIASFNQHDVKSVEAYGAFDMIMREAAAPKDQIGSESAASVTDMFNAFPDGKLVPTSTWGAGDYVVVVGRFEGTNKGAMTSMGIKKPTGRAVSVGYTEMTRWENGKIKEDWLFYDGMAFASQLGLLGK